MSNSVKAICIHSSNLFPDILALLLHSYLGIEVKHYQEAIADIRSLDSYDRIYCYNLTIDYARKIRKYFSGYLVAILYSADNAGLTAPYDHIYSIVSDYTYRKGSFYNYIEYLPFPYCLINHRGERKRHVKDTVGILSACTTLGTFRSIYEPIIDKLLSKNYYVVLYACNGIQAEIYHKYQSSYPLLMVHIQQDFSTAEHLETFLYNLNKSRLLIVDNVDLYGLAINSHRPVMSINTGNNTDLKILYENMDNAGHHINDDKNTFYSNFKDVLRTSDLYISKQDYHLELYRYHLNSIAKEKPIIHRTLDSDGYPDSMKVHDILDIADQVILYQWICIVNDQKGVDILNKMLEYPTMHTCKYILTYRKSIYDLLLANEDLELTVKYKAHPYIATVNIEHSDDITAEDLCNGTISKCIVQNIPMIVKQENSDLTDFFGCDPIITELSNIYPRLIEKYSKDFQHNPVCE